MPNARVLLLWHMHQPMYRDPESGEYILPWVRLHATRAYYDMAKVLGEFEGARAVINLVPSLLWQLQQYVDGVAKDRFLELTRKPADTLEPADREFLLKNFFMVDWDTCIRPLPRYWELLNKRGRDLRAVDLKEVAQRFSVDELRDLQCYFNLAWMGFRAEEEEESIRALKAKQRNFTEADKAALLASQQRVLRSVMPALAEVWRRGQAELTVTPFYHPILPLLVDSESARRAMPNATLPTRFAYPEDAHAQVKKALDFAQQHLGQRPVGMWPAEGSVSPEACAVFAAEGVQWIATDEGNLLRSRPHRERSATNLYRPYRVRAGGRELNAFFRDRGLSDLIGFTYSKTSAEQALDDLFGHLTSIGRQVDGVPLVTIALDGENAWEHYPNSGRDFLRGLYKRLADRHGGIEPVTASEALQLMPPTNVIEEIHSGSWIESNFRIWISHPEDNLGWTLLGEARARVRERERDLAVMAPGPEADALGKQIEEAKAALLVAEGSDWFWWYGDDFSTESSAEFDALFRGYVKQAWRALGLPPPLRLEEPITHKARPKESLPVSEPQGFIRPRLDGRISSYFDWTGAGVYSPDQGRGSMFQGQGLFSTLHYGFDEKTLFIRLDPVGKGGQVDATDVRLHLTTPNERIELQLALREGTGSPVLLRATAADHENTPISLPTAPGGSVGRSSFRDIFEAALPFEALGLKPGVRLAFAVQVMRNGVELERFPRQGQLSMVVPDEDYERKNWKV